jgi:hypothetical protein
LVGSYQSSAGGNVIDDVRFVNIGGAYNRYGFLGTHESHAAIHLANTSNNIIRNSEFLNITNDASFPPDYSTYGGLHAIYILNYASGNGIWNNTFRNVYARGVIKMRNFSNGNRILNNEFFDNTILVADTFCSREEPICNVTTVANECPSWGTEFSNNTYKYFRAETLARPTVLLDTHPANDAYCGSQQFWTDTGLDRNHSWFNVAGKPRIIQIGNTLDPSL